MKIALLFDSKSPTYGPCYGNTIRTVILQTDVLQQSACCIAVGLGDLPLYGLRDAALADQALFSHPWRHLFTQRLRDTYGWSTLFAWQLTGIDEPTALRLHVELTATTDGYLGMHCVDFAIPAQAQVYGWLLQNCYWLRGRHCAIHTAVGERAEEIYSDIGELRQLGFVRVRRRLTRPW